VALHLDQAPGSVREASLLWIPITLAAAALQTARNAFQRGLTGALSPLGATYTRFLFGFPFAVLYAAAVTATSGAPLPAPSPLFFAWVTLGGVAQIVGTAFLLRLFQLRDFGTGVAFSKSEILQAALFGFVFLGDHVTPLAVLAIGVATAGLLLLARGSLHRGGGGLVPMTLGLGSGAGYAIAAVAFRAASLSLGEASFVRPAALTLVATLAVQSVLMGVYLRWREPRQVTAVGREWRRSLLPGLTGAAASACWFSAMTLEIAAYVRMLGLVEVLFGFGVSLLALRERPQPRDLLGSALLLAAIGLLLWDRL
jgi:drug/metabolite transporter (DMT)-like permease